jgi:hypothetical protein
VATHFGLQEDGRVKRLGAGIGIGIACAVALTACTHEDGASAIALSDWDGGPGMLALLSGTLAVRDGCVVVSGGEGAVGVTVPIFPRTYASWDADTSKLTYNGVQFAVGDAVAAGGGGGENLPEGGIPSACVAVLKDANNHMFYINDDTIAPDRP